MNTILRMLAVAFVILILSFPSCKCSRERSEQYQPVRSKETGKDQSARVRYTADEIIVMYKGTPLPEQVDRIKQAARDAGINMDSLTIRRCNSCSSYVELWNAKDIHTVIHGEGIRAGTVSDNGSDGVGEDSLARYSLNFIQRLPVDSLPFRREYKFDRQQDTMSGAGKDTVIIAVLDTGIDTVVAVNPSYVWKNTSEKATPGDADGNCYPNDVRGWNFVSDNANIYDDNQNLHGTLVSQYIVNEFRQSPDNFVQLMALKTHDHTGHGDLFSSICAMHYAIDKGANIINASWGFYYYDDGPHPYMDSLITQVLRQKGILFVTAAGNKIDEADAYAKQVYMDSFNVNLPDELLRNLAIHNFYPACLSDAGNNVITVTTTDGTLISPTQNYSSRYVDLGVKADVIHPAYMKFTLPFSGQPISGSSFATAIATGKIGAFLPVSDYIPDIKKENVLSKMQASGGSGGVPVLITFESVLENKKLIRNGRMTKRE